MNKHNQVGFTLIEVVIAVAIVGILASVAYPSYTESVRKSRRADAQVALMGAAQQLERCFTEFNAYNNAGCVVVPAGLQSPEEYYDISAPTLTASTFTVRATPVASKPQNGDGYFELDQTQAKRWDKNNDGDTADADEDKWTK